MKMDAFFQNSSDFWRFSYDLNVGKSYDINSVGNTYFDRFLFFSITTNLHT